MNNYSDSPSCLNAPSSEFINLCQFQLNLWNQTQKADWSAVYLTQELSGDRSLIPVAIYPPKLDEKRLLSDHTSGLMMAQSPEAQEFHQAVLPLIYQDRVLGLLVTRRKQSQWDSNAINQGEKIAQTLALAYLLDQRQSWYQQQLELNQQQQAWQATQLDNLLHQLRNPLTAIRTFSKLLLKRLSADQKSQTAVEGIVKESDRLQDLLKTFEEDWKGNQTEDIRALPSNSPLLLPPAHLSLELVNLVEIMTPLLTSAQAIAQEKDIQLISHLVTDPLLVYGNSQALREVFTNLLDNAIKYTPKGGQVQVKELEEQNNYQGIAIVDSGYGIPPEDIERIFERHYRGVQKKGNIPGTGLGLSIVKAFIDQMQGKITVISPNQLSNDQPGTTFEVWLLSSVKDR